MPNRKVGDVLNVVLTCPTCKQPVKYGHDSADKADVPAWCGFPGCEARRNHAIAHEPNFQRRIRDIETLISTIFRLQSPGFEAPFEISFEFKSEDIEAK